MINQNHVIIFIWYANVLNMAYYGSDLWPIIIATVQAYITTEFNDLNQFLYHQEGRENWRDFFLILEIAILMTVELNQYPQKFHFERIQEIEPLPLDEWPLLKPLATDCWFLYHRLKFARSLVLGFVVCWCDRWNGVGLGTENDQSSHF